MHVHFSGIESVKIALTAVVLLGTMNLLALKYMNSSSFFASWANLFGLV